MTLKLGPMIWLLFSAHFALCLNLNYVSPETRQQLVEEFERSKNPLPAIIQGLWTCEMFGMQTGLQHEKDLKLYSFTQNTSGDVHNTGISPNELFKSHQLELIGSGSQVTEYIRFPSDKELISKLVHTSSKKTLAFAKCRKTVELLTKSLQSAETVAAHD